MHVVFLVPAAVAQPPIEVAEFERPALVGGFVERTGHPGCSVHFEFHDPDAGWTRFRYGLSAPSSVDLEPSLFLPPHDLRLGPTYRCGNDPPDSVVEWHASYFWGRVDVDWRIVDGRGKVLTDFNGPFAVDAMPLAEALSAMDDLERGRSQAECVVRLPGTECWTALELWLYLEDWADLHCEVEATGVE